jgi:hypothetical protein
MQHQDTTLNMSWQDLLASAIREPLLLHEAYSRFPHKTLFHELGYIVLGHTSSCTWSDSETLPEIYKRSRRDRLL